MGFVGLVVEDFGGIEPDWVVLERSGGEVVGGRGVLHWFFIHD